MRLLKLKITNFKVFAQYKDCKPYLEILLFLLASVIKLDKITKIVELPIVRIQNYTIENMVGKIHIY